MLNMLRGRQTVVYLSDLMRKVGATNATYESKPDGTTQIIFTLPDGRTKGMPLPRTAKLIDDKKGTEHAKQI